MTVYAIIPARYEASRFPGKPVAQINGRPMIWYPYMAAKSVQLIDEVFVATDSVEIVNAAEKHNIKCMLTEGNFTCGTERVAAAYSHLPNRSSDDVIINIQCDEVMITGMLLHELARIMLLHSIDVATAARRMRSSRAALSPTRVKVVVDDGEYAMYFSRAKIPHAGEAYLEHIGVYAFSAASLAKADRLGSTELEKAEDLEQLRWLCAGMAIHVHVVEASRWVSVNTPEDVAIAESIFHGENLPEEGP